MGMVAPLQRIASAFFVLLGRRGDVTREARQRGVSRQALYRESHQVVAAVGGEEAQAEAARLRRRNAALKRRLRRAWAEARERRPLTATVNPGMQAEFASVGQAEGVSLPVLRTLLRVVLGEATPSVATLGRHTQAAARRARELLAVLDEASRPLVRQAAPDEIFVGRAPILVVVEPDSLRCVNCRLAPSRDGREWARDLRQLPALEQVTCDRGSGLLNGVKRVNAERKANGQKLVADQADHFHLFRDAARALRLQACEAARAFRKAEQVQQKLESSQWHGSKCIGVAGHAAKCWRRAVGGRRRWTAGALATRHGAGCGKAWACSRRRGS